MYTVFDIETIPSPDRQHFLDDALEHFKAPTDLTKEKALQDLGIVDAKGLNKEQAIALWLDQLGAEKSKEAGDQAWRKTSFDGAQGRVLSIAWCIGEGQPQVLISDDEPVLLREVFGRMFAELKGRRPYWIGHHIPFDLKFMYRRAVILGIEPPFELPFKGRHGHDFWDNMQAWCEWGEKISQDNLAKALGLPGKDGFDGSMVCDAWLRGDLSTIAAYNLSDIATAWQIFQRQRFLGATIAA